MVSKITKNGYANLKSVFPIASSILSSKPFHQRENSMLSPCSKICGVSEKGKFGSGCSSRFFSSALWKGGRLNSTPFTISNTTFHNSLHHKREFSTEGVVMGLIAANAAVFLSWRVAPTEFMVNNFMISVDSFKSGRVHTLITSAFSHHDTFHFMTNMIGLYFFGTSIGQLLGPEYLLKLYLSGAYAGSTVYLAFHNSKTLGNLPNGGLTFPKASEKGASGAVNAIVLLGMCLYPFNPYSVPGPAMFLGLFLVGMDVSRMGKKDYLGYEQIGGTTVAILALAKILFSAISV